MRAAVLLFGLPWALFAGAQLLTGLILASHYGGFSEVGADPILAQHLTWLAGHPGVVWGLMLVPGVVLVPWGVSVWWLALSGSLVWRVAVPKVLRVAGWLGVILCPFAAEALYLGYGP